MMINGYANRGSLSLMIWQSCAKYSNITISQIKKRRVVTLRDLECFNIKQGNYRIDEYGNVWSNVFNKYLSYKIDKDGYHDLLLMCSDNKRRHFRVHRLVAATYLNNENNYPIVLHLDNNKSNNHFSNLKWGTVKENTQQAYDDGCCSCNKNIFLYDRESRHLLNKFNSISELARYFGFKVGYVGSLGKIASGDKKHPKYGKLSKYIITFERL